MMSCQRYFTFCILVFLCAVSRLGAGGTASQRPQKIEDGSLKIGVVEIDYCSFLNEVAANDPCGLYDEKMDCIVRSGIPSHYIYTLASEEIETYIDQSSIAHNDGCSKTVAASTSTLNFNSCEAAKSYRYELIEGEGQSAINYISQFDIRAF